MEGLFGWGVQVVFSFNPILLVLAGVCVLIERCF